MRPVLETFAYAAARGSFAVGKVAAKTLPRAAILGFFQAVAAAGFYTFNGFRRRSTRNLALAFGDKMSGAEIAAIVRGSLRNFFRAFAELGFAVDGGLEPIRRDIPARGLEHLEAALAKKRGVIVISAHFGNFLLLGSRLAAEGYAVYTMINQPRGDKIAELRKGYREKIGQRTIHAYPRDEAFKEVVQVLRRNEIAIVIADEFRSRSGVEVPFFGRTVVARRGPATLALRTRAAVVPASLLRRPDGGLELVVEPELEFAHTGKIKSDVVADTLRMTEWLEKTVRAHPDQWNWMPLRWREDREQSETTEEDTTR